MGNRIELNGEFSRPRGWLPEGNWMLHRRYISLHLGRREKVGNIPYIVRLACLIRV